MNRRDRTQGSPDGPAHEGADDPAQQSPRDLRREDGLAAFVQRAALAIALAGLAFIAWQLAPVLLAGFGGVLFAVVFRRLGVIIARHTPLNVTWGVALVLVLLALLIAIGIWSFGNQLTSQVQQLVATVRESSDTIGSWLQDRGIDPAGGGWGQSLLSWVTSLGSMLWQVVSGTLLVLFVLLYLSLSPEVYRSGLVALFPKHLHRRADEVLDAMGTALWRWTLGRFVSMAIIAVFTTTALWLLDVPLAFLLGVIAGLLEFVPVIGPFLAAVPAVIVAFSVSPGTALWVIVAYGAIQQVESWIVAPLAERSAVAMPPALSLLAIAGFGLLFGMPGVLFATPLALVIIVFIRMVIVSDLLDERLGDSQMPP